MGEFVLLLCTRQLRQNRFGPCRYFSTFSLHYECCCLSLQLSLKEMSFELLAWFGFFTCVIHLHIWEIITWSNVEDCVDDCVRMRFCTAPLPGHLPQPDREALTKFGQVDFLEFKHWSMWEPEMPGQASNNRLLAGHQSLTWFRMADLELVKFAQECWGKARIKPDLTLRQFPGRPDVAIRLSLALEKLTYLCRKQGYNSHYWCHKPKTIPTLGFSVMKQLNFLFNQPCSFTVNCSPHSWEGGTREVKLDEVHGGGGRQEEGVGVGPGGGEERGGATVHRQDWCQRGGIEQGNHSRFLANQHLK